MSTKRSKYISFYARRIEYNFCKERLLHWYTTTNFFFPVPTQDESLRGKNFLWKGDNSLIRRVHRFSMQSACYNEWTISDKHSHDAKILLLCESRTQTQVERSPRTVSREHKTIFSGTLLSEDNRTDIIILKLSEALSSQILITLPGYYFPIESAQSSIDIS